ncbi:hypothetical protein C8R44DRAFT_742835 [Mycena epipterygia]|nr:hypothetical protein C8R44DRAFT_742835 [Mycena epipterygia]
MGRWKKTPLCAHTLDETPASRGSAGEHEDLRGAGDGAPGVSSSQMVSLLLRPKKAGRVLETGEHRACVALEGKIMQRGIEKDEGIGGKTNRDSLHGRPEHTLRERQNIDRKKNETKSNCPKKEILRRRETMWPTQKRRAGANAGERGGSVGEVPPGGGRTQGKQGMASKSCAQSRVNSDKGDKAPAAKCMRHQETTTQPKNRHGHAEKLSYESAHKDEQQGKTRGEKLPKRHRTTPSPRGTKERAKPGILDRKNEAEANRKEMIRNRNAPAKGLPAATVVYSCGVFARGRKPLPVLLLVAVLLSVPGAGRGANTQFTRHPWARGAEILLSVRRGPGVAEQRAVAPRKERTSPDVASGWYRRAGEEMLASIWEQMKQERKMKYAGDLKRSRRMWQKENGGKDMHERGHRKYTTQAERQVGIKEGRGRKATRKEGEKIEKMASAREAGCRVRGNKGQTIQKLAKKAAQTHLIDIRRGPMDGRSRTIAPHPPVHVSLPRRRRRPFPLPRERWLEGRFVAALASILTGPLEATLPLRLVGLAVLVGDGNGGDVADEASMRGRVSVRHGVAKADGKSRRKGVDLHSIRRSYIALPQRLGYRLLPRQALTSI